MNYKRILALLVTMAILLQGTSQVTGQQDELQSPQGTYGSAFTDQGQLKGPSGAVNGTCDLRFRLFDAAGARRLRLSPGAAQRDPGPGTRLRARSL